MRTTIFYNMLPVSAFVDVETKALYFKYEHVVKCLKLKPSDQLRRSLEQEFGADAFKFFPFSETAEPTLGLTEAQVYYIIDCFNSPEANSFRKWFIGYVGSLRDTLFRELFYKIRLEIKSRLVKELADKVDIYLDLYD